MSTTISMWFGVTFLVLGVTAVLLQAWLWNPKYWDEGTKKTRAPALWLAVHRAVGYTFFLIYVVMMWHMVPRLWEYQVELPPRTIIHATAAIVLGVLLVTKLSILRFFRYFEEAMPKLGFGILMCTVVIGTLSLPFAARGHGLGAPELDDTTRPRVARILAEVGFEDGPPLEKLMSGDGLARGREVLVSQCVRCHDMRTILARPRTGRGWFALIDRMTEKPSVFGQPIASADVPYVTAYMVSITPQIQESAKGARQAARSKETLLTHLAETPAPDPRPPADAAVDPDRAKKLLESRCTECHELDDVEAHGTDTPEGWREIIRNMVDEGAEITAEEARVLVPYLSREVK